MRKFNWYNLKQRFSLRKYHFGVASILLGTAIIFGSATTAQATELSPTTPTNAVALDGSLQADVTSSDVIPDSTPVLREAVRALVSDTFSPKVGEKVAVKDLANISSEEKVAIEQAIRLANPDLPDKSTILVANDGSATLTYEDSSTDTLSASELVYQEPVEASSKPIRQTGITYKVTYTDAESGKQIFSQNKSEAIETTEDIASKEVTVTADFNQPALAKYKLADDQESSITKELREKSSSKERIFDFKVVENTEITSVRLPEGASFRSVSAPIVTRYDEKDGKAQFTVEGVIDGGDASEHNNNIIRSINYSYDSMTNQTTWLVNIIPSVSGDSQLGYVVASNSRIISVENTNETGKYGKKSDPVDISGLPFGGMPNYTYKKAERIGYTHITGGIPDSSVLKVVTEGEPNTFYIRTSTALVPLTLENNLKSEDPKVVKTRYDETSRVQIPIPKEQIDKLIEDTKKEIEKENDKTPPAPPTLTEQNGSVTVTPPKDEDTKTVEITYTPEGQQPPITSTVTKGDNGQWTTPDQNLTVDPNTGKVTIPADKIKDGTVVTAVAKDKVGNVSPEATVTVPDKPKTPQADLITPKDPEKTPVVDKTNLTEEEKGKVSEAVKKANPDFPASTTV
ncbi:YSIRK-type signal peptide-containing protein, partial [Streptococcus ovuberis]